MRHVVPSELLEIIALTDAHRSGAPPGSPDRPADRLADRPADRPAGRIVVGCDRGHLPLDAVDADAFDVLLTPTAAPPAPWVTCPDGVDAAVATLTASVEATPQAALVLVHVLRATDPTPPPPPHLADALVVESLGYSTLQAGREFQAWLAARPPTRARDPRNDAAPVGLVRADATLHVTLRRPWVRNAVDAATRDGLVEAFTLATLDDSIAHIDLRGEGPSFCSGGDLSEFGTASDPATAHLIRTAQSPARAMARCAPRVTATVQGACVGAGIELAALAGHVVAEPDAFFLLPELSLGLIPGAGGTATIPRRIGRHRTTWFALSGQPVDVATARHWGLVDEVTGRP